MDIFAHGLWAAAGAKALNLKHAKKKPVSPGWSACWGVFPDLFSFTPMMLWMAVSLLMQTMDWPTMDKLHQLEPGIASSIPIFQLTYQLYNLSHSLVIFGVVFLLVWLIRKKPVLPLAGWGLHILIDIPTHTARFFPTPFLWPLADVKIDGYAWSHFWMMVLNYTALLLVYAYFHRRHKRATP